MSTEDPNIALAMRFGMEVVSDAAAFTLPKEFYRKVSYAFVKRHHVLPVRLEGDVLVVGVADPLHLEPLEELRHLLAMPIKGVYCPMDVIQEKIHQCYEQEKGAASQLIADLTEHAEEGREEVEGEVYDLLDARDVAPMVKLLNLIITEAIQQGASDIHFEPFEDGMRVRYRIDGVLLDRHTPAQEYQSQLLTRIKVMARVDIAERRLPQDGRIKLRMGRREVDFRVSTVPVVHGERIVMRILDKGNVLLGLEQLGMLPEVLKQYRHLITLPEGIILVTGPTGSGKTTSLYSSICEIGSSGVNIMTIEDPVEYKLHGIAQIGVRPKIGLDFATGLRHILRQDPDIVMIGEIRDRETAEIAVQASLTGHLVMSTLHTNDAPSAVTRLVDMGIEPYLLSSTLVGVLAQRLVRKICPHCKTGYTPTAAECREVGLSESVLYKGKGCDSCFGTGYRGRCGVYELMLVDPALQGQIVKSPDAVALRTMALEHGMVPLKQHGALLVKEGVTTISEVLRVTRTVGE